MGHINVATRCEELWHETGLYEGERQGIKLDGSGTISDEAGRDETGRNRTGVNKTDPYETGRDVMRNNRKQQERGKERKSRNTIVNSSARRVTGPRLTESLPLPPKAPTHRRGIQAAISPRNERCNRDRGDRAPLRYPGGRPHEAFQHRFQPHGTRGHGCWRPPCAARACYIIRYTDEN